MQQARLAQTNVWSLRKELQLERTKWKECT